MTIDIETPTGSGELGMVLRRGGMFVLLFACLWVGFKKISDRLPFVRPGAEILYKAKLDALDRADLFEAGSRLRVAVFGNSRILSGFVPRRFDGAIGPGCSSFNFGLPDASHFVPELVRLIAVSGPPTHVLLPLGWSEDAPMTWVDAIRQDQKILAAAFPFRKLPRDILVFAVLARSRGGLHQFYRESAETPGMVMRDKGYYFIRSQSHYPGDCLPDSFSLPTDRPDEVMPRVVSGRAPEFARIAQIANQYKIRFVLVPDHFRVGSRAAAQPVNQATLAELRGHPWFAVAGPDYVLYEPQFFADPIHLNPKGAERYTDELVRLFREVMAEPLDRPGHREVSLRADDRTGSL